MVQITIFSIENYGPWTHTLGNDREHKLQMYQAILYESLQNMVSVKGGLVFSNRFDEYFAITDGLSYMDHLEIKTKLETMVPFKVSISIANHENPFIANKHAHTVRTASKDKSLVASFKKSKRSMIHLIHLDIEGITQLRDIVTPYEISMIVQDTQQIIIRYCYENKLLGFFMGGDNFVIISDPEPQKHSKRMAQRIFQKLGIVVNCGIGQEYTARIAMAMATKNLDTIRHIRTNTESYPRILDNNSAKEHSMWI